eukprot:14040201-Ditylum_brightwellii.AAC.1
MTQKYRDRGKKSMLHSASALSCEEKKLEDSSSMMQSVGRGAATTMQGFNQSILVLGIWPMYCNVAQNQATEMWEDSEVGKLLTEEAL